MAGKLEVKQVKSLAGASENQRKIIRALGLRRREQVVLHDDTPSINGMVKKVWHLVKVTKR